MSVISHALAFAGATGKVSRGGKAEYTAHYRVTTDDKEDQIQVVAKYFKDTSSLPHPDKATTYSYGNDSDTAAICDSVSPRRQSDHPNEWIVAVHFGDAQDTKKGEDDNGNPTDNPLDFATVITHRTKVSKRPATKGEYISGFGPGRDALIKSFAQPTAIVNSVPEPYDPPAEKDYSTLLLSITKNVSDPISGLQMLEAENTVNSIPYSVNHPSYNLVVPKHHSKINSIVPDRQRTNGISYWRVTTELEIDFEDDWRLELLDQGVHVGARAGDPDGQGGTISNTDINDGDPLVRMPIDKVTGHPLPAVKLLDGEGQPLGEDGDPVFGVWRVYKETATQTYPWLFGVLI